MEENKNKKKTPGATNLLYLWEIKNSFLMLCLLTAFSPDCTEELLALHGAIASSSWASLLQSHWLMSRESEWWKSPSCSQFLFESKPRHCYELCSASFSLGQAVGRSWCPPAHGELLPGCSAVCRLVALQQNFLLPEVADRKQLY